MFIPDEWLPDVRPTMDFSNKTRMSLSARWPDGSGPNDQGSGLIKNPQNKSDYEYNARWYLRQASEYLAKFKFELERIEKLDG